MDSSQRTPLSYAAQEGHVTIVKHLLDNGNVNLNSMSKIGYGTWRTPLSCAAENGHEMVVKLLLERGAKPELYIKSRGKRTPSKISSETTPLGYAAMKGHKEVVKLLLEDNTLHPDKACESYKMTPLAYAARGGHEEVVKLLLEDDRIHLDKASGCYEQTPLSYAATEGHEGVVKLLLEKGANPNLAIIGARDPVPAVMDLIRNKAEANLLLATSNNSTAPKLAKKETVDNSPPVAGGGDRGQTQVHNAYSLFSCFGFTRRKK
ncbi:ankyrin repeat-containing domain protein [Trichoderma pleuroticola]